MRHHNGLLRSILEGGEWYATVSGGKESYEWWKIRLSRWCVLGRGGVRGIGLVGNAIWGRTDREDVGGVSV